LCFLGKTLTNIFRSVNRIDGAIPKVIKSINSSSGFHSGNFGSRGFSGWSGAGFLAGGGEQEAGHVVP